MAVTFGYPNITLSQWRVQSDLKPVHLRNSVICVLSTQEMAATEHGDVFEAMRSLTLASDDRRDVDAGLMSKEPSKEEIETKLEKLFLSPNQRFDDEWLNRLQQCYPRFSMDIDICRRFEKPLELDSLFMLGPTISRSRIRFIREGLEGRISGYEEVSFLYDCANIS